MPTEPYTPAELEAVEVLIAHGRTRIEGCDCGWGMDGSKLGQSHALHVWRELQRTVLPDHDARIRAQVAEEIAQAIQEGLDYGGPDTEDARRITAHIARACAATEGDHHG